MRIVNGRIITMEGCEYAHGYIEFDEGIITAIGSMKALGSRSSQDFDAEGGYVLPGLIDAHSHVGIVEDGTGGHVSLTCEATDLVTPEIRMVDSINPRDKGFYGGLSGGVTSAIICPGSVNAFAGQGVHIKLQGRTVTDMIIKDACAMKMAMGENPRFAHSLCGNKLNTRMKMAAVVRETLMQLAEYKEKRSAGTCPRNYKLEAILPLLEGGFPAHVHSHQANDILTALALAEEFDYDLVIVHGSQSFMVKEHLAQRGVTVICGPFMGKASKQECAGLTPALPGELARAGVNICISVDHPVVPLNCLALSAAIAVREGLDESVALQAITINPAKVAGTDARVGSLKVGKDADIAVFSRHPFHYLSQTKAVFVDGQRVFPCLPEEA